MDVNRFTQLSQQIVALSQKKAQEAKHSQVELVHFLTVLVEHSSNPVAELLKKKKILKKILNICTQSLASVAVVEGQAGGQSVSRDFSAMLLEAENVSRSRGDQFVSVDSLFLALVGGDSDLAQKLQALGLERRNLEKEFNSLRGGAKANDAQAESKYNILEKYSINLTKLAEETKLDPIIGRDEEVRRVMQVLSRRTKNNPVLIGEPGVGKTAIAEGLAQRIIAGDVPESLKGRDVVSLDLGAMVAGAKFRGEFEERFKAFIAEVQKSAGQIILFIDELHTLVGAGKTDGAMDAGNLLKPALARGELRCIGATTLDEYRKYIEKDAALERRFQQVYVGEPSAEEATAILRGLKEKYEVHHGVKIKDSALIAAVKLSDRYIGNRFLPDKAIDLMDEAASYLRLQIDSMPTEIDLLVRSKKQLEVEKTALLNDKDKNNSERLQEVEAVLLEKNKKIDELQSHWMKEKESISAIRKSKEELDRLNQELLQAERLSQLQRAAELKYGLMPNLEQKIIDQQNALKEIQSEQTMLKLEVDEEDIASIVAKWTGVPVTKLIKGEQEKLLNLEKELNKRVKGQDKALTVLADAVRAARSGLKDPSKPIGSFLFLGPTGVGKTETAKSIAESLFDDENHMVRIDMSEYMEKHSVARLIGAPPGYVGYDQGGQLTEAVRRRPYSVVLFDEIEKAHVDVLNVLLQIMDDGRITDSQGTVVDFKNTLIVMTSNIASDLILENVDNLDSIEKDLLERLKMHLRPEFINRVDELVVFKALDKAVLGDLVDLQVSAVNKMLLEKELKITLDSSLKEKLGDLAYDPQFGARPLKRVFYKELQVPLSKELLKNKFMAGDQILAKLENGEIVFLKN